MAEEERPRYNFSNSSSQKPSSGNANNPGTPSPPTSVGYQPAVSTVIVPEDAPSPALLIVAVLAALVAGGVCAWLYALFVSATGFSLSLITIGIGWVIGFLVITIGRRPGLTSALLSGATALVCLLFSRYLLVGMEIEKRISSGRLPEDAMAAFQSNAFDLVIKSFGWSPISIVILLIGVYGAFKVPYRADGLHD